MERILIIYLSLSQAKWTNLGLEEVLRSLKIYFCLKPGKSFMKIGYSEVPKPTSSLLWPAPLASVSQNNRTRKHFRCSWFTIERVVHLRVVQSTWNFGSRPKIGIYGHLIFYLLSFWPTVTALATPLLWTVHCVRIEHFIADICR